MISPHELPLLLAGARAGVLDPDRVAAVVAEWDPSVYPRLTDFLVTRGVITSDLLRHLVAEIGTVVQSTPRIAPAPATPEDEVSALLAGRLDETPTATPSGPDTARPDGLPAVGSRYRLLRLHRGGGLGQVWLGYDTVLGRQVAVKVLRPDRLGLPAVAQRFVAEGKAAGRLEHPNIVPVYDLVPPDPARGRDAAYVMRFVAGRTLSEAARDYHLAPSGADPRATLAPLLDAFVLVCKAVAFAHSKGVLHRDLKGANIILGEYGEVQLLDWGLAKPMTAVSTGPAGVPVLDAEDSDLTVTGGVVGTPAYVAPEVAGGADASPASDVYGLGATLYAVLTGKPPADGPTPQAVLDAVRLRPPLPPRAVNPAVPVALDAIVRKAMHRDPRQRYATADDLAKDLRAWLADEPVAAHPDGVTARVARWGRRHRTLAVAVGVLLVAGVVGLATADALLVREQRETAVQRQRAEDQLAAAVSLLRRLYTEADTGLTAVPGTGPARERLYTVAIEAAVKFQGAGDEQYLFDLYRGRGGVRALRLNAAGAMADYEAAARLPVFDHPAGAQACDLWGEMERLRASGGLPPVPRPPSSGTPYSLYCEAQAAVLRKQYEEALVPAKQAAQRFAGVSTEVWAEAEVYQVAAPVLLARVYRLNSQPVEGLEALKTAERLVTRSVRAAVPVAATHIIAEWQLERAYCLLEAGRLAEAETGLAAAAITFGDLSTRDPDFSRVRLAAINAYLVLASMRTGPDRAAALTEAHRLAAPLREVTGWREVEATLRRLDETANRP